MLRRFHVISGVSKERVYDGAESMPRASGLLEMKLDAAYPEV